MTPSRLRWLLRHAGPRTAALVGALVALPGLFTGLSLDDHWFRANAFGSERFAPILRPKWDQFSFYAEDASTRFLRDLGVAPWWTDEELRIRFFRPLAAATHWFDARVLGGSPLTQHVQSLIWYALLVWAVALLLRRVSSSRFAATVGALIFAVTAGHSPPATWISNRNAVISTLFGVLAVRLHLMAVQRTRPAFAAAAALVWVVALGAGEMALGALGFFVAAEIALARDALALRARRLAPHALVLVAWTALYRWLGFGVRGSGMYVDPGADPVSYLLTLPGRFAALFGSSLTGLPPEAYSLTAPAAQPLAALGLLVLGVGVLLLFRATLRRAASARFFLLAFCLAALPACSTLPAGRLLVLASVASAGLLGEGLVDAGRRARGRASRVAVAVLALLHGPFALLGFVGSTLAIDAAERRLARASRDLDDLQLENAQCIVFAHAPLLVNGYLLAQRETRGQPSPHRTLSLSAMDRPVRIRSEGATRLLLEAPQGLYGEGELSLLTRSLSRPFDVGVSVEHPCGRLTVEAVTARGVPSRVRFDAARAGLPLLEWVDGRFVRLPWPAEGLILERAGGVRI